MTTWDEPRTTAVGLVDVGQLDNDAHHPCIDSTVVAPIAEDRIRLDGLGPATVERRFMALATLAPNRIAMLDPNFRVYDRLHNAKYGRMVR